MILHCACCGSPAPSRKQWHNRDEGFGVCRKHFLDYARRHGLVEAIASYGKPGIHHSIEETPERAAIKLYEKTENTK